jgi:hypothetical protein
MTEVSDTINAQEAAQLLTLVASGYFAYMGYSVVFPRSERGELATLVASIAFSLSLVALARALADLLDIAPNPTQLAYAGLLIGVSLLVGYLLARLRETGFARRALSRLRHRVEPEQAVLLRTVQRMSKRTAQATVTFKDGRVLAGTPRFVSGDADAEDRELYLDHTQWFSRDTNAWTERRNQGGVLVRLSEVQCIEIDSDPD